MAFKRWQDNAGQGGEAISLYRRVLMQDFTGVPAVVDFAALRDVMIASGRDASRINLVVPLIWWLIIRFQLILVGLMLCHNVDTEMLRNHERYKLLKWGQDAFDSFRVVPPGKGVATKLI